MSDSEFFYLYVSNLFRVLVIPFAIVVIFVFIRAIFKRIKKKNVTYVANERPISTRPVRVSHFQFEPIPYDVGSAESEVESEHELLPYKPKPVLTETEQILFFRLFEALPDFIVLSQVQMSGFLSVSAQGRSHRRFLNKILFKSVDFLICNKDFNVVAAVELQDKTHYRSDRVRSDEFKRDALGCADLRLVEFWATSLPTVEEIKERILS